MSFTQRIRKFTQHADMLILQINTRVRIQVALEFSLVRSVAAILVSKTMNRQWLHWCAKSIVWDVNAFHSFGPT